MLCHAEAAGLCGPRHRVTAHRVHGVPGLGLRIRKKTEQRMAAAAAPPLRRVGDVAGEFGVGRDAVTAYASKNGRTLAQLWGSRAATEGDRYIVIAVDTAGGGRRSDEAFAVFLVCARFRVVWGTRKRIRWRVCSPLSASGRRTRSERALFHGAPRLCAVAVANGAHGASHARRGPSNRRAGRGPSSAPPRDRSRGGHRWLSRATLPTVPLSTSRCFSSCTGRRQNGFCPHGSLFVRQRQLRHTDLRGMRLVFATTVYAMAFPVTARRKGSLEGGGHARTDGLALDGHRGRTGRGSARAGYDRHPVCFRVLLVVPPTHTEGMDAHESTPGEKATRVSHGRRVAAQGSASPRPEPGVCTPGSPRSGAGRPPSGTPKGGQRTVP